ncbi:MAG: hypothetical protein QOF02_1219 [Blastocatellia bacterium]|jgi:hypothetical protein|nr:hypothetical protein [Blastocatellia bacterium]
MSVLFALLLIVAGALAAASLIIKNQPNARDLIAKLVPFQGIIGIILMIWALVILLFNFLPNFSLLFQFVPIRALLALVALLVAIALGFLLGYGLIAQYALNKNAGAASSGEAARMKLAPIQGPLGIVGIVLGLWMLFSFMSSGI